MTFVCDGVRYDSADLLVYPTGAPHEPFVYMTPDHSRVFVGVLNKWMGFDVHRADATEIETLAAQYGIDELRRAIS